MKEQLPKLIMLSLVVSSLLLTTGLSCGGSEITPNITVTNVGNFTQGEVFYKGQRITKLAETLNGREETPVVLIENPISTDPTYQDLIEFLSETREQRDSINTFDTFGGPTLPFYTCGYYLEDLNNLAEQKGIQAGMAFLKSDESHGINVFNTTDKGLVYVDASYYEDRVFTQLAIGDKYEVYGHYIVIEDIEIIWKGLSIERDL